MTRASDIAPRAVRFLYRERVPVGMVTLVAGRPGGAKSALLTHLAATVSHQHEVIVSHWEATKREVVRPRLEAADANLSRIDVRRIRLPYDLGMRGDRGPLFRAID